MDAEDVERTEHSPLLGRDGSAAGPIQRPKFLTRHIIVIVGVFVCKFLFLLGSGMVELPLMKLEEDVLCHQLGNLTGSSDLQANPSQPGRLWPCNQDLVQKELSVLRQWHIMSILLPTLLVGVPMGIVADRYGRTIVLGLALLGSTLALGACVVICALPDIFPLRLIWLTPVFALIGGGEVTVDTMVYAIIADVAPESQRLRAVFFSLFGAGMTIGGMVDNPIIYLLMKRDLWLSVYVGFGLLVFSILLGFALPETLKKSSVTSETPDGQDDENDDGDGHPRAVQHALRQAKAGAARFLAFLHLIITEKRQVGLLLLSVLFTAFGKDSALMLIQYVHVRFGWEWGEAGLIVTVQQTVTFVLCIVLIPLATKQLSNLGYRPRQKDLLLTRLSGTLQIIGGFAVALATTPGGLISGVGITGLAGGYAIFAKSLMTSLMGKDIAILYTVMSIQVSLGVFIANPLLSALFRRGIDLGGMWMGLPFMMAAVLYTIALCVIGWIKVDDDSGEGQDSSSATPSVVGQEPVAQGNLGHTV